MDLRYLDMEARLCITIICLITISFTNKNHSIKINSCSGVIICSFERPIPKPLIHRSPGLGDRGKEINIELMVNRLLHQPTPSHAKLMLHLSEFCAGCDAEATFLFSFSFLLATSILPTPRQSLHPQTNTSTSHTVSKLPSGSQGVSCFVVVFLIFISQLHVFKFQNFSRVLGREGLISYEATLFILQ